MIVFRLIEFQFLINVKHHAQRYENIIGAWVKDIAMEEILTTNKYFFPIYGVSFNIFFMFQEASLHVSFPQNTNLFMF